MADDLISIKVNLGDRYYPLTIKAGEEENVRKAAKWINDKSKFYQEQFAVRDKQDLLAMTALEFASELLARDASNNSVDSQIQNRLNALIHLIEKASL